MNAPDDQQAFHTGERQLQARVGVEERMAALGDQVMRTAMPEQHRTFFTQLPFVIAGSVEPRANPGLPSSPTRPGSSAAPMRATC